MILVCVGISAKSIYLLLLLRSIQIFVWNQKTPNQVDEIYMNPLFHSTSIKHSIG